MPFYFFIWTDENEQHLADHGVSPDEFEEVVQHPQRVETSRTTGRPIAFGTTGAGRELACVYDLIDESTVYPVTSYEPDRD
jgi:uncharacterized DUF497 family protein